MRAESIIIWLAAIAIYGILVICFVLAFIGDPRARFVVGCFLFFGVGALVFAIGTSMRADREASAAELQRLRQKNDAAAAAEAAREAHREAQPEIDRRKAELAQQERERQEYLRLHPTPYPYLRPTPVPSHVWTDAEERAEILRKYGAPGK